jgi:hypothetical protein
MSYTRELIVEDRAMATDTSLTGSRGGRLLWAFAAVGVVLAGTAFWLRSAGGTGTAPPEPTEGRIIQGTSFDVAPAKPAASAPPVLPPGAEPLTGPIGEIPANRVSGVVETVGAPPAPKENPIAPAPPAAAPATPNGRPAEISFATLAAYRYALPPRQREGDKSPPPSSQIPSSIQTLSGKKITIEGYMIPMDFEKGKILRFVLSRSMIGCCFADSLRINEMIKVSTADGKPVDYCDIAKVTGTLEVGEEFEDGYLVSLYRLVADQVKEVPFK